VLKVFLTWALVILWEDDRCLHVALLYDIRYKCQLNLSLREQLLLPALDVFGMGWVQGRIQLMRGPRLIHV